MMELKSVGMIFHSQYMGSHNPVMFQTTNQYISLTIINPLLTTINHLLAIINHYY